MKRNRRMLLAALAAAMLALLAGCAGKETPLPPAAEAADRVLAAQSFSEEMTPVGEKRAAALLDLAEGGWAEIAVRMDASRTTAETVIVVAGKDAAQAETLGKKLEAYLASLKEQYRDYRPEEMPKLEAAAVQARGLQRALIVSPDPKAAREALERIWEGK